jgi:uncharacterized membrane protein
LRKNGCQSKIYFFACVKAKNFAPHSKVNKSVAKKRSPFSLRSLFQYFLQGLIVIAPLAVTIYVVWWIFTAVDNIIPNILGTFFPQIFKQDDLGIHRIPGLGLIVTLALVLIIGRISSTYLVGKMVAFIDHLLEKTPGIKLIYTSVKDFLQAFTGNKKKFDKPVLVNVDGQDIWRIGFITQDSAGVFGLEEHVIVYVPHSYALSGITYMVPKEKIKFVGDHVKSSEAMKFTVSGGVTDLEHKSH